MLEPAILHEDALNRAVARYGHDERLKYYWCGGFVDLKIKVDDSTWNGIQSVSLSSVGEVTGYFSARIARWANYVDGISIVNFTDDQMPFGRDLREFIVDLFVKLRVRKIKWTVNIGNPAESLYDRVIEIYGGRVVGTFHDDVRLWDGTYCDCKYYELMYEDFMARMVHARGGTR